MNYNALVLWALLSLIGYFIGGTNGARDGLTAGLGVSFLAACFSSNGRYR